MKTKSAIINIFNGLKVKLESVQMSDVYFQNYLKPFFEAESKLLEKLSPEITALYQESSIALNKNHSEEIDFYFSEGFKLGLLIGLETSE